MWRARACCALVYCLTLACTLPAHATGIDLALGRSAPGPAAGRNIDDATVAFVAAFGWPGQDLSARFQPVATLGWVGSHHAAQGGLDEPVVVAGGGMRYRFWHRLFVSEQIVAASRRTSALSSRFEFVTTLGIHVGPVLLMGRHISNAHLIGGGPNHGETMLLIGVRFR
ncbi:MAG TPA: hypothetical protein VF292_00525 [Rhodanobacteraceae bacterium]